MDYAQPRPGLLTIKTHRNHQIRSAQGTDARLGRIARGSCMTLELLRPVECLRHWRSRDVDLGCGWPYGPVPGIRDSPIAGCQSKHQSRLRSELSRLRYSPGAEGKDLIDQSRRLLHKAP